MTPEARIKSYLTENGIAQAHISRKTGIGVTTLNSALMGHSKLTVAGLMAICRALGKTPNDFLLEKEQKG